MHFRLRQHIPFPVPVVEGALVDPAFLEHASRFPDLGSPELLEQRVDGDRVHQRVRYRFVGELSAAVTSVVDPARLTWVDESTLDRRAHRGQHRIVPDHYGDRLRCTFTTQLSADTAGGTERVAEGELRVRFPLVGGKVERAVVSGLMERAELEAAVVARWLRERG